MALLSDGIKEKEFDVRMVQRGLSKGLLSHDDVAKKVATLGDDTENADYINLDTLREGLNGKSGLRD